MWWRAVRVDDGDTLSAIAQKYRVTRTALLEANHLRPGDDPETGTHLILPLPPGREPIYRRGRYYRYRIRSGDTLGGIARRFHVSVESLRRWNHLRGSVIVAGRTLQVFGHVVEAPERQAEYKAEVRNGVRVYRIQRGDTLETIARHFHVSVDDLRRWNNLNGHTIVAGRTLKIGGMSHAREVAVVYPGGKNRRSVYHYRIRHGDTLTVIANHFKVTVAQIREWNHLDGSVIVPGQVLALYRLSD